MIAQVAELDENNKVINIEIVGVDNFGVKENYEKTNEAMRAWYKKRMPNRDTDKLILLFTRESANIGDIYDESESHPVRFLEDKSVAAGFPENIGFWDEELQRWFVYKDDQDRSKGSNRDDFINQYMLFKTRAAGQEWF